MQGEVVPMGIQTKNRSPQKQVSGPFSLGPGKALTGRALTPVKHQQEKEGRVPGPQERRGKQCKAKGCNVGG